MRISGCRLGDAGRIPESLEDERAQLHHPHPARSASCRFSCPPGIEGPRILSVLRASKLVLFTTFVIAETGAQGVDHHLSRDAPTPCSPPLHRLRHPALAGAPIGKRDYEGRLRTRAG